MNRTTVVLIGSLLAAGLLYVAMSTDKQQQVESQPVMLYCAASNRAVVEKIRAEYEQECGRSVQIQYGPSQTLLSSIEVSKQGDLYLPADDSYLTMGRERSLIKEILPIASMQGVIVVPQGNPKKIQSFQDLLKDGIRVVQANEAAAIGKQAKRALTKLGLWEQLDQANGSLSHDGHGRPPTMSKSARQMPALSTMPSCIPTRIWSL